MEGVVTDMNVLSFYQGKRVFVTGHTGFKGSWLCKALTIAGAEVMGYSLAPSTVPDLFSMTNLKQNMTSVIGDIRNLAMLQKCMTEFAPQIVIHLAAQPIVRISYDEPVMTYETNVMGTVNILEAIRHCDSVKSFVNVTTDKVYQNNEWEWGYRENERLDGYDPYSNSKSCSELVTSTYVRSFYSHKGPAVSTARAGNVIGGGDFAPDRIIPDCISAAIKHKIINVRNPNSTRPYQHVLEPVIAYLLIAQKQYEDRRYAGQYNIGPDEKDCVTTGILANIFCSAWGEGLSWDTHNTDGPHEANFLKLDCSKAKQILGWTPQWDVSQAVVKTIEWTKAYISGDSIDKCMESQIISYVNLFDK